MEPEISSAEEGALDGPHRNRRAWVRASAAGSDRTPPQTFAEALEMLGCQDPPHPYADHVASALNRMADVLGRSPEYVPTEPVALRLLIASALPAEIGMSQKRWARIRSLVTTYLRKAGVELEPGRDVAGHSQAWVALFTQTTKKEVVGLSRFASFCTRMGVEPQNVTPQTFHSFGEALMTRSLKENPSAILRNTVTRWNRAAAAVEGWPGLIISQERHERFYSLPWDAYPATFRQEVDTFLSGSKTSRWFSRDYRRKLRTNTTALYRRQLRVLAALLIESGLPIDEITSLEVLLAPSNVERLANRHIERKEGRVAGSLVQGVALLHRVAIIQGCPTQWIESLKIGARNLASMRAEQTSSRGMVKRNRDRLRQFDLAENRKALLFFADRVFAQARKAPVGDREHARRVMLAMSVELALVTALRGANLTSLEIGRHFSDVRRDRTCMRHVVIPAAEMKGNENFEMRLSQRTTALMDEYLANYWPVLAPEGSPYLFPNRYGRKRDGAHFAKMITDFIRKETGLVMHLHLFRHFVVKLHLDLHPHDIETARRLLQHRSTRITQMHYAEARSDRAHASWHHTLDDQRRTLGGAGHGKSV